MSAAANTAVLVVDDVAENRDLLVRRLKRLGLTEIEQAGNGIEALAAIERRRFDLVLLDIMMPELDGFGVLERLKANATSTICRSWSSPRSPRSSRWCAASSWAPRISSSSRSIRRCCARGSWRAWRKRRCAIRLARSCGASKRSLRRRAPCNSRWCRRRCAKRSAAAPPPSMYSWNQPRKWAAIWSIIFASARICW